MNRDLEMYQTKLEDEKKVLIGELQSIGVIKDKRNPDDWQATPTDMEIQRPDANEVADRIESYEGNTALVNELEQRLNDVDTALGKIKDGKFGTCEIGGEQIEADRLEANPAARTCKKHMNV